MILHMRKDKAGAVLALSFVMSVSLLSGCSMGNSSGNAEVTTEAAADSKSSSENEEKNKLYGVVSEVSSDSITINVGTLKERSESENNKTEDNNTEDNKSEENTSSSDTPAEKSMITTTGETKTISLTDSTKVSQERPGNPPQQNGSDKNSSNNDSSNNSSSNGSSPDNSGTDNNKSGNGGNGSKNGSQEQPPEKPDESNSSQSTEKNSEEQNNSKGSTDNGSQNKELSVSDLKENDEVSITLDSDGNASAITLLFGGGPGGQNGESGPKGGGGQSAAPTSYTAVTEYTTDKSTTGKSYSSTGTDENAVHVTDGASVTLKDATVSRKSEESQGGDSSSFYGIGAALLTTDGTSYISGSRISTNAKGGAGIFSYKDGVTYVSDTTISTKKDTSGGLHVAGGGKLYAWNVNATTQGESSAAIRSDRGGGTMVVDGGTYTSNGTGSPAVYSTADIAVHNANLTANNSESVCIEGLNSLRLFDCNLTGNMKEDSQNDCTWNVILYQSMSGDSEVGNSTFEMNGGTLTAKNGGMFYTTNTESTIYLSDVDITYAKDNAFFLKCTGNSNQRGWGTSGANGADCNFTADNQKMEGDVIWDSISKLDFYMANGSTLKGAVTDDESNAGNGGDGYCNFYIAKGSTWTVTGDSTLTKLYNAGTIVDNDGKAVTIKGTDGTVYVKGESKYTVTVSSYSTKADLSGMTKNTAWKDYEVSKPSEL